MSAPEFGGAIQAATVNASATAAATSRRPLNRRVLLWTAFRDVVCLEVDGGVDRPGSTAPTGVGAPRDAELVAVSAWPGCPARPAVE